VHGLARLCVCVCLSVCVSVGGRMPTLLHGPGCNLGSCSCALLGGFAIGARVALVWQHYGNAWQSPAVIRQAHLTPHACRTRTLRMPAKTPLVGDKIDAPASCSVPFRPGFVTRTRNVSECTFLYSLMRISFEPVKRAI